MARLLVHVEGQTEEGFINELLKRHLEGLGYKRVDAKILGNPRHKGGIRPWPVARDDIVRHLKSDRGCFATTLVDYYGMPQSGSKAWPGRMEAASLPARQKAPHIEEALLKDVAAAVGAGFDRRRFIPFVMLHEFEALLFSDCAAFGQGIEKPGLAGDFQAIRDQFDTPEDINDSPHTAPSKRIEALIPKYKDCKPLLGNLAALEIGLEKMRAECPHFRDWLAKLEHLAHR